MDLELLTIGTELLLGFTVDTNSVELAQALAGIGVRLVRRTTVGDDPEAIRDALSLALRRTGAVITTGGLGPTRDDLTKQVVADCYQAPLEFQEDIWQHLVARFARLGRATPESNRSQAEVPRGAIVLPNRRGTAPGLWLEGPPGLTIMLPGVPSEMRQLLEDEVVPRLRDRAGGAVIRSRTIRTTGIAESALAERVHGMEDRIAPLTLAYLPGLDGVDLRVSAWGMPPEEADARLADAVDCLRRRAGDVIYGEGSDDLAAVLLARARQRGSRIAVAESCTGGLVGARITAIPGSSDVFVGGVIAYDNAVKSSGLGVDPALLAAHGAVSEPVAGAMAAGAAARFGTDLSLAVTGIAGPSGGTEDKPVGLVCFGTCVAGEVETFRYVFPGTRHEIRARAAQVALYRLYRRL